MKPSKEMIDAYFNEMSHYDYDTERVWFWYGIAAYTHLSSPASDEWKRKHGFAEKGD